MPGILLTAEEKAKEEAAVNRIVAAAEKIAREIEAKFTEEEYMRYMQEYHAKYPTE